ncbi:MAG TPA: choice-of-anchor tandem repeat GloVer-containing protein, partial [Bacteroidia bacterium]|nr:choice-of-anchor tandem repeat GloVer-containing protein [Bacteroidia bacterium]
LLAFNGTNGAQPVGYPLVYDNKNGILYGTTQYGGNRGGGEIFSYNISTGQQTVVYSFGGLPDGNQPSGMIYDSVSGLVYGLTLSGGSNNLGTLFSFNPGNGALHILYNMNDSVQPSNNLLTIGPCGLLYWDAPFGPSGNGALYSFNPVSGQANLLYSFAGAPDGSLADGSLTLVQVGGPHNAPVPRGPKISLTSSSNTICPGSSATLTASGAVSYVWSNGATTSSVNVSPTDTTIYTVIGTGTNGCASKKCDTVKVNSNCIPGNSPANAISVIPTVKISSTPALTKGMLNTWFSFIADSNISIIKLVQPLEPDTPLARISTMKLYSGSPNSLTLMATDTVLSGSDTLPLIMPFNLVPKQTYYVEVSYSSISNSYVALSVQAMPNPTPSVCSSVNVCGTNLVTNGNFETPSADPLNPVGNNPYYITPQTNMRATVTLSGCGFNAYDMYFGVGDLTSSYAIAKSQQNPIMIMGKTPNWGLGDAEVDHTFFPIPDSGHYFYGDSPGNLCVSCDSANSGCPGKDCGNWDVLAWQQQNIPVDPGAHYVFSYWIKYITVHNVVTNPPIGCAEINAYVNAPAPTVVYNLPATGFIGLDYANSNWKQICYSWSADTITTSATPQIYDIGNISPSGFDFGIDDISFSLVSYAPIALQTSNGTRFCVGKANTILTATPAAGSFVWAPATGLSSTTGTTVVATPSVTTTYTVSWASGSSACPNYQTTIVITIDQGPQVIATSTPSCGATSSGSALAQASGGVGPYTYLWSPSGETTASATNLTGGVYTVTVTDFNGCTAMATTTVTINPKPTVTIASTSGYICPGSSVTLTANGTNISSYSWSSGETTSSITVSPASTSTYSVTVENANGTCSAIASSVISIQTITITGISPVCAGKPTELHNNPDSGAYRLSFHSSISGFPCNSCLSCPPPVYKWTVPAGVVIIGTTSIDSLVIKVPNPSSLLTDGFTLSLEVCCGTDCCTQTFVVGGCCTKLAFNGYNPLGLINGSTTVLPTSIYKDSLTGPPYVLSNINTSTWFYLEGTFTVNASLTINSCDVLLGSYAQIIVEPGYTLTINNSHLHACAEMWDGIDVKPGGTLVISNCLIEDAIDAVTSEGGARYTIFASDFNKDYVGINVLPYAGIHKGTISGTRFRCYNDSYTFPSTINFGINPQTLIGPAPYTYRTLVGVNITNVKNITVGDVTNSLYDNVFNNVDCGVQVTGGICQVYNCTFRNIMASATMNPIHRLSGIYAYGTTGINTQVIIGNSP